MEIKKVASDNRGEVFAFDFKDKVHTLVSFAPNTYRGGHFHKFNQWHTCLGGNLMVKLKAVDEQKEETHFLTEGQSINIPARVAHLFLSVDGEALLAESRTGEYEAEDYEPYRKLARPI